MSNSLWDDLKEVASNGWDATKTVAEAAVEVGADGLDWVADKSRDAAAATPGLLEDIGDVAQRTGGWIKQTTHQAIESTPEFLEDTADMAQRGGAWAGEAARGAVQGAPQMWEDTVDVSQRGAGYAAGAASAIPGIAEDAGDIAGRSGAWAKEQGKAGIDYATSQGARDDAEIATETIGSWFWSASKKVGQAAVIGGKWAMKTMEDNAHENQVLSGKVRRN